MWRLNKNTLVRPDELIQVMSSHGVQSIGQQTHRVSTAEKGPAAPNITLLRGEKPSGLMCFLQTNHSRQVQDAAAMLVHDHNTQIVGKGG